jgi:hypothetical protein
MCKKAVPWLGRSRRTPCCLVVVCVLDATRATPNQLKDFHAAKQIPKQRPVDCALCLRRIFIQRASDQTRCHLGHSPNFLLKLPAWPTCTHPT